MQKPGVFPIKGNTSLLQIIAMANGFDQTSDWTVLVSASEQWQTIRPRQFDVDAIQKGHADDPTCSPAISSSPGTSAIKHGSDPILKALPLAGLFAFL